MQIVAPRPTLGGLMTPLELPDLEAWYDLSRPASTTSDDIRISAANLAALIADKSGNSAVNCLCLNGVAGNYASAPDSNALDITSDIDIRVDCAAVDWTPSESHALVSKYGYSENQRSYYFYLNTAGELVFRVAVVGTVLSLEIASGTATGIADLARSWVRVTYDQNSGAGQYAIAFWKSPDGAAWTQIGTTKTGASVAATFTGTAPVLVGSVGSLATNAEQFNGRIYRAIIKSGIDGTTVFDADFTAQAKLATSFTEASANAATVTINATGDLGAHIAGERDLYQFTDGKKPVYDAATRSITFDGTNDYMKAPAFALSQPETVYFVGKQVTWTADRYFYDSFTADRMALIQRTSSPNLRIYSTPNYGGQNGDMAVGTLAVSCAVYNGSNSLHRINRNASIAGPSVGTGAALGFTLGSSGVPNAFANITVSEILIFSAAHDKATQDRVIQYLGRKWGIAV